ncbi:ROK family transcriptional regulator [Streptomyces sp. CAU 1734]|uniref:ROK family transcriptional regulator n=1 Tax=Streptomyces sp. CAU 1734 TaxID=3140360 RepID=UPI003260FB1B
MTVNRLQPGGIRSVTLRTVLDELRVSGPLRVADLAGRTSLSRPTVMQAVAALEQAGYAAYLAEQEDDPGRPRMGRPARRVRFRTECGYAVGVDIGAHKILAVVSDLAGTRVGCVRTVLPGRAAGDELLAATVGTIRTLLESASVPVTRLRAITVGTPGVVDAARGTVTQAPHLNGWPAVPLTAELTEEFGCPVHLDNDVNLAVQGERAHGVAGRADTVVYVLWGARLGAGLVVNGVLHRGSSGAAGEIGHIDLGRDGARGSGGDGLGDLEKSVGAATIARLGRDAARRPGGRLLLERAGGDPENLDAAAVFAAAADHDPAALEVVTEVVGRFVTGIAPLFLILDPDLVVLGGGVSRAGPVLLDLVHRELAGRVLVPPRLALSSLGEEAVATGAVHMSVQSAYETFLAGLAGGTGSS